MEKKVYFYFTIQKIELPLCNEHNLKKSAKELNYVFKISVKLCMSV